MDYAKDNLEAARSKTVVMWQKITSEEDNGYNMNERFESVSAMVRNSN